MYMFLDDHVQFPDCLQIVLDIGRAPCFEESDRSQDDMDNKSYGKNRFYDFNDRIRSHEMAPMLNNSPLLSYNQK